MVNAHQERPYHGFPITAPAVFIPMQESHTLLSSLADANSSPLHDEIAQCARGLWVQYGQPADRDLAIWLEAEQRLLSAPKIAPEKNLGSGFAMEPKPTKSARASNFGKNRKL